MWVEVNVHTYDELGQGGVEAMAYTLHVEAPGLIVCLSSLLGDKEC